MIKIVPQQTLKQTGIIDLRKNTQKGIRIGFYHAGKSLVKLSKKLINTKPKSGRFYTVYVGIGGRRLQKPRLHQASAPNEAPAVITGRLRKSIDFRVHGYNNLEFGSYALHGRFLELGTVKMAKRPYLLPAIKQDAKNTTNYLRKNIVKFVRR